MRGRDLNDSRITVIQITSIFAFLGVPFFVSFVFFVVHA